MNITQYFSPERGPSVISPDGLQKYTEALDSYTQLFSSLNIDNTNSKFAIDSAWESGNIYFCNYDTGYVKKIRFDGTEIASLQLTNPLALSVLQYSNKMESTVTNPPQQDKGVWVIDKGTNKAIKTDNELNILVEVGASNAVGIISTSDGGCYIVKQYFGGGELIKFNSIGNIQYILDYSAFIPAITSFSDLALDSNDNLWLLANDILYSMRYENGSIYQRIGAISPLGSPDLFSSSSSENIDEEMHIGAIDVDRNSIEQYLYITGGNSHKAFIVKYDSSGNYISEETYHDITFPYIIKVVQGLNTEWVYLLEDTAKWDEYEYGSSSSSSSS